LNTVSGDGLYGSSNTGNGVEGVGATGVSGTGNGAGTYGVYGTNTIGVAVYGLNTTAAGGQPAVLGVNNSTGPGVVGFSSGGTGLAGGAGNGNGLAGIASGTGNGVVGQAASGNAVVGVAAGSGRAGYFQGPVTVTRILTVMGSKSAAVRGANDKLQRLYCVESPESWFEDFGSGQLSNGSATIELEPGFAGVVKADEYHVFLTADGDCKGLYVSKKTPNSLTVHELRVARATRRLTIGLRRNGKTSRARGWSTWRSCRRSSCPSWPIRRLR
jgi:hypothetical protein